MQTKIVHKIYVLAIVAIVMSSCEDVIELDLQNSEPKLVIESILTDDSLHCATSISMSENFYQSEAYTPVVGAKISVTDNHNNEFQLAEEPNGIYSSRAITGQPGTDYKLQIIVNNKEYIAYSSMPRKVILDSLDFEWAENPHNKGYMVQVNFVDPANEKNYYRFRIYKNGLPYKDSESGNEIIVWDDKLFDGNQVRMAVKRGGNFFAMGDTIRIELISIDKETYNYLITLKSAIAKNLSMMYVGKGMMEGSAAPANPLSNINNDALGYFAAIAISTKTIIIRENIK
jgi:hypothetical protein